MDDCDSGGGGFSSSGGGGFSSGGDGGFSSSGDGGFSGGGDGGFSSGGDVGFGSSGREDGATDHTNSSRCYSFDQGEDNKTNFNQGPFTSCDEPDKTTNIVDVDDNDSSRHGLSIYSALAAASAMKDPFPDENGEAPMSLLLADSKDPEESNTGKGDDCGPMDCLYYCLHCCTIM